MRDVLAHERTADRHPERNTSDTFTIHDADYSSGAD